MTQPKKAKKPKKPYSDYPLFAHGSGQWAKNIRGKFYYFGPWDDPHGALTLFVEQRDFLYAGSALPSKTVGKMLNSHLDYKKQQMSLGELSESSFKEIKRVTDCIIEHLGKNRSLENLGNLEGLRAALARGKKKPLGPAALKRRLTLARAVFRREGIDPGDELRPPPARALRRTKQEKWYESHQLRTLVQAAEEPLRSMILLGYYAGYGPQDVLTVIDKVQDSFIRHVRPKTGIARVAWIPPELNLLPLYDVSWSRFVVARHFRDLCDATGVPNYGFYSLRRTTSTILQAFDTGQATMDAIFGWARQDMASVYRQRVFLKKIKEAGENLQGYYTGSIDLA